MLSAPPKDPLPLLVSFQWAISKAVTQGGKGPALGVGSLDWGHQIDPKHFEAPMHGYLPLGLWSFSAEDIHVSKGM